MRIDTVVGGTSPSIAFDSAQVTQRPQIEFPLNFAFREEAPQGPRASFVKEWSSFQQNFDGIFDGISALARGLGARQRPLRARERARLRGIHMKI